MAMTKIQREILKANIRAELCFKIPPYISSPEEWASAIDKSTDAISVIVDTAMDIIKKRIKEVAE